MAAAMAAVLMAAAVAVAAASLKSQAGGMPS